PGPGARPPPAHRARRAAGRPHRHRHPQLPGVGHRLLGCRRDGGGGRPAERMVDGAGARLRAGRLGRRGARGRRRAARAHRAAPRGHGRAGDDRGAHRPWRGPMGGRRRGRGAPAPRGRDRPRGRRHHHVHVGHHRPAQGRGGHAQELRRLPHERGVPDGRRDVGLGRCGPHACDAAHLPALPRGRPPVLPPAVHRQRRQARPDVQVGCRRGGRARRAGAGDDRRRCAHDGVPAARDGRREGRDHEQPGRHLLGGHARAAGAGEADRRPGPGARQRLRPHRDVGGRGRQPRPGVRRQAGQRRPAHRTGDRRAHRRRRRRAGRDRGCRRDLAEGAHDRAWLLQPARGDGRRLHRRLVPHRRPGPARRRGLPLRRRPPEGRRDPRRGERLRGGGRGGALRAPRRHRGRDHRRAARPARRGGGRRPPRPGRRHDHRGRGARLGGPAPGRLQGPEPGLDHRPGAPPQRQRQGAQARAQGDADGGVV
ncbi:MAG: Long-chain-fatty-acid--CoA ligase, partial [uncultured Acidimicrobiales bacterium]